MKKTQSSGAYYAFMKWDRHTVFQCRFTVVVVCAFCDAVHLGTGVVSCKPGPHVQTEVEGSNNITDDMHNHSPLEPQHCLELAGFHF